jgi:hypothetical protein
MWVDQSLVQVRKANPPNKIERWLDVSSLQGSEQSANHGRGQLNQFSNPGPLMLARNNARDCAFSVTSIMELGNIGDRCLESGSTLLDGPWNFTGLEES